MSPACAYTRGCGWKISRGRVNPTRSYILNALFTTVTFYFSLSKNYKKSKTPLKLYLSLKSYSITGRFYLFIFFFSLQVLCELND